MEDQQFQFGSIHMGMGRAFPAAPGGTSPNSRVGEDLVRKRWIQGGDSALLVESVPYPNYRKLEAASFADSKGGATIPNADAEGVVIDFIVVPTIPTYTFEAGQTYRVTGYPTIDHATFEAWTVLKYDRGAQLRIDGSLNSPSSGQAILTAIDDQTIGEFIVGTAPRPSGTYANVALYILYLYPYGGTAANFQVRHAYDGIMASCNSLDVEGSTFVNCTRAITAYYTTVDAASDLIFCEVPTVFYNWGGSTFNFSSFATLVGKNDNDGDLLSNFEELVWWWTDPLNANSSSLTRKDGEYHLTAVTGQSGTRVSITVPTATYNPTTDTTSFEFIVSGAFFNEFHNIYAYIPSGQYWRNLFADYDGSDPAGEHYIAIAKGNLTSATFASLLNEDRDFDMLSDGFEVRITETVVGNPDSSSASSGVPASANNGIIDSEEDFDQDGWSNAEESLMGINPLGGQDYSADLDADGLPDWAENVIWLNQGTTNPGLRDDSDGDGVDNYTEVAVNTDPSIQDAVYANFSSMSNSQRAFTLAPMTVQHTSSSEPDSTKDLVFDNAGTLGTYLHLEVQRNQDGAGNPAVGQDTIHFGGAFLSPPGGMYMDMLVDGDAPSDAYISRGDLLLILTSLGAGIWEEAKVSAAIDQMSVDTLAVIQQRSMLRTVVRFREIQLTVNLSNPSTGDQILLRRLMSEIHTEIVLFRKASAKIAQLQGKNWSNNAGHWVSSAGRLATVFSVIDTGFDIWDAAVPYIQDVRNRCDDSHDTAADLAIQLGNMASTFADSFNLLNFWLIFWDQLSDFDGYDSSC